MLRLLVLLMVLLALGGGGFYFYKTLQKQPTKTTTQTTKTTSSPAVTQSSDPCEVLIEGSADVPPLYSGLSWSEPMVSKEEILEYDEEYNPSTSVLDGCVIRASGVISEKAFKFDDAYDVLTSENWRIVLSADGPDGSMVTYKKDGRYLLLEQRIDPKNSSTNEKKYNLKVFYSQ